MLNISVVCVLPLQVLKAWSPAAGPLLATKPVYWSRLHSLVEALSERLETLQGCASGSSRFGDGSPSTAGPRPQRARDDDGILDVMPEGSRASSPSRIGRCESSQGSPGRKGLNGSTATNPDRCQSSESSSPGESEADRNERVVSSSNRHDVSPDSEILVLETKSSGGFDSPLAEQVATKQPFLPPLKKERRPAKADLQELGRPLEGMSILVAEDTPILQVRTALLLMVNGDLNGTLLTRLFLVKPAVVI
jgi:hypothetical protein